MNARRARPHGVQKCPKGGLAPARDLSTAERDTSRARRLRYLRAHAVALALIALLIFVALPPALVAPAGGIEVVATGAVSLLGCVLVGVICYESLRR